MKKFLAILLMLLFSTGDAFATIEVGYSFTGARSRVTYGALAPTSAVRFGSKATFMPANRGYATPRHREVARPRPGTMANSANRYPYAQPHRAYSEIASNTAPAAVSRLNKNYSANKVQKTYTRGGVTYYN